MSIAPLRDAYPVFRTAWISVARTDHEQGASPGGRRCRARRARRKEANPMVHCRDGVLLVASVLAILAGCGSSTGGAGGGGGTSASESASSSSTGAGGSSTASSSSQSASASGTGGGSPGVTIVTCYLPSKQKCSLYAESNQANIDAQNAQCTSDGGTPAPHCTSAGLVGCCLVGTLGSCYYEAQAAQKAKDSCPSFNGMWTTTPLTRPCHEPSRSRVARGSSAPERRPTWRSRLRSAWKA